MPENGAACSFDGACPYPCFADHWTRATCVDGHFQVTTLTDCPGGPSTPPPPATCPTGFPTEGEACAAGLSCPGECFSGEQKIATCVGGHWKISVLEDCGSGPPPPPASTVGKACTADEQCDLSGAGMDFCGTAFTLGPLSPTPTCIEIGCTPSPTDAPAFCGGSETGICLRSTGESICIGACRFDQSGGPPTGCLGKDACHAYAWRPDASGKMEGLGYCIGGCRVDGDCPSGSACQTDGAICVKKVNPTPKKQDEPCKPGEGSSTEWSCNCVYDAKTSVGYCANACIVNYDSCGPDHLCDAMLPTSFSVAAKGLSGACLKICASDTECPLGTACLQSGGMPAKTCQPTNRP